MTVAIILQVDGDVLSDGRMAIVDLEVISQMSRSNWGGGRGGGERSIKVLQASVADYCFCARSLFIDNVIVLVAVIFFTFQLNYAAVKSSNSIIFKFLVLV